MKKRDKIRLSVLIFAAIVYLMLGRRASYAALSVEPENVELVVDAGKISTGIYNVVNEGNEAVHVTVQPESWPRSNATSGVIPVDKWLTVPPWNLIWPPRNVRK